MVFDYYFHIRTIYTQLGKSVRTHNLYFLSIWGDQTSYFLLE